MTEEVEAEVEAPVPTFKHPTAMGLIDLPWPRGSKQANRYFQQLREKENTRAGKRR